MKKIVGNKDYRIYHWSHAEVTFINKAFNRYNVANNLAKNLKWFDLLKFFKDYNIAIKGVFGYGLKNVANGLYKHNLIKTQWESECVDGLEAMLIALHVNSLGIYETLEDYPDMKEVIKYNEIDCKVLYDIRSSLLMKKKYSRH